MKYTLCLLTYNELEGCKLDVPLINYNYFDEIFALDGGSTDGTIEYLKGLNIKVVIQKNKGYNNAYIEAFDSCNTEYLIFFHPKGSVSPDYIQSFKGLFEQGNDLVIASRCIKGAHNEEDDKFLKPRKWFVLILGWVAGVLWHNKGYRVRDVLHGFRGMRVDAFRKIKPLTHGLSIDLEMVVRSYKFGYKQVEFPVAEKERLHGTTHFNAWPTGKKLLGYLWFELNRKE